MITYVETSIFDSPADALVNTVNTVGVMGKGVANEFRKLYKEMFEQYQMACEEGRFCIGDLMLYRTPNKLIINFPTKKHWRSPSNVDYIEAGLKSFANAYSSWDIVSVAFPQLGCGNGELDWEKDVRPLMEKYLGHLPIEVFIHLYASSNTPEHRVPLETREWLRSEPRSLPVSEVWKDLFSTHIPPNDDAELAERSTEEAERATALRGIWEDLRSFGYIGKFDIRTRFGAEGEYLIDKLLELPYVTDVRFVSLSGNRSVKITPTADLISDENSVGLRIVPQRMKIVERVDLERPSKAVGPCNLVRKPCQSMSDNVGELLDELRSRKWLTPEQRHWTRYAFHFTDITNVANILKQKFLYPRDNLSANGIDFYDTADERIVARTPSHVRDKVRLYFRPRVPMLFEVEGFKTVLDSDSSPHCPIPVYLLFDSLKVLSLPDTLVSRGNCGKVAWTEENRLQSPVEGLKSIPFESVYHSRWLAPEDRERIVFHRQAEILVHKRLDLKLLKGIRVRSQAELQTLRTLIMELEPDLWKTFGEKVKVNTKHQLFGRHRMYVDSVRRVGRKIFINMNSQAQLHGPFDFHVRLISEQRPLEFRSDRYEFAGPQLVYTLPADVADEMFDFEILLNGRVAFRDNLDTGKSIQIIS